ncbi:MAG: serine/threonine protein kinase [Acidobacteria bacterium]|nr:serine/threonine protein kinase [Acidobacteriota bacterium]
MSYSQIGKYEIVEEIGHGGMGYVYKAFDPIIERTVAIKVVSEHILDQEEMKQRFYREAKSAGRLSHPNITIVHDVGEIDGRPYIVMEYLGGTDMKVMIKEEQQVPLERKIDYGIQIARALDYAHNNKLVHRDIKPENVKVLENGRVKIMDFGIAKPESSDLTEQGTMLGTPSYMSPEQVRGLEVDRRSDIFSFGVLLQELLSYKKPFSGNSTTTVIYKIVHEEPEPVDIPEVDETLSEAIQHILTRCLQKDPDRRYSSCADLIADLEALIVDWGLEVTSDITNPSLRRKTGTFTKSQTHPLQIQADLERTIAQKRKIGWLVWTLALVLVLTVIGVAFYKSKPPEPIPVEPTPLVQVTPSVGLDEVLLVKSQMLDAKAAASIAGATGSGAMAEGEKAQAEAESALERQEFELAVKQFQLATDQYNVALTEKQAEREPEPQQPAETDNKDPLEGLRVQVQRQQRTAQKAREGAVQASAEKWADESWRKAEDDFRHASTAAVSGEKAELSRAVSLYEQATTGYRKAAQSAIANAAAHESAVKAKLSAEKARAKLEGVPADQLEQADMLFDKGESGISQGTYGAAEKNFRLALNAYEQVASSRMMSAQANAAAKRSAAQQAKAQAAGVTAEDGDDAFQLAEKAWQSGDFEAAAKQFDIATAAYQSSVAAAKSAGDQDKEQIEQFVQSYVRYLENEDLAELTRLLGWSSDESKSWQQFFDFAISIKSEKPQAAISIQGDRATVQFPLTISYENSSTGKRDKRDMTINWSLARADGQWRIVSN